MVFWGVGSHFYNNFVLCGSIFFIFATNELYLHWLSADTKYIDLCGTLERQAHKQSQLNHKNGISAA